MGDTERRDGYYGDDGEFYPGGASGNTQQYDELYPKRPEIRYTTTAYPGTNPPAEINNDDVPDGDTGATKYCKFCGKKIPEQAVICSHCGGQVENMEQQSQPTPAVENSTGTNEVRYSVYTRSTRNKWVALFLCFFFGIFGVHKFYEGKIGWGLLYLFTFGLGGIGWLVDIILLLCKPNWYDV